MIRSSDTAQCRLGRTRLLRTLLACCLAASPLAARADWTEDARLCATIDGDPGRAIASCTRAIESARLTNDELIQTFQNRSFEYLNLRDFYNALIDASTAIGLAPSFAGAWNQRGRVHFESGSLELAIADFTEALRLYDLHGPMTSLTIGMEVPVTASFNLGLAYEALSNRPKAAEYFQRAYSLAPAAAPFQEKFREYGLTASGP